MVVVSEGAAVIGRIKADKSGSDGVVSLMFVVCGGFIYWCDV